jgi:heat shock protein HslJ
MNPWLGWAASSAVLALTGCAISPPVANGPRAVILSCENGRSVGVTFTGDEARLDVGGRTVRLAQQPSGSGIHYAGEGNDLRGKGADLTWTDAAGTAHACRDEALAHDAAPAGDALAGTEWSLVNFTASPAAAPVAPPNPERYVLRFAVDGSLSARLDCNRAVGRWTATPSAPNSGALSITGGAMTRAMCGPGAIDAQIARDLSHVRSYAVEGGRLSLILDGGDVYLWAPAQSGR